MNTISPAQIAALLTEDPNRFLEIICEEYEQGTHPSTQNFWQGIRGSEHPFSAHPLMAMYGDESARKSYEHTLAGVLKAFPQLQNAPPQQVARMVPQLSMQAMQQIGQMERPHQRELESLCVNLVSSIWGVPAELLDVKLVNMREMQQVAQELNPEEDEQEEPQQPEPEGPEPEMETGQIDREQVNKRITMNALTQGAAVHNMGTIHHAATNELEQISPQLLQAYSKFSSGSTHAYWIMDFANMSRSMLQQYTIGTSKVDYGDDEGDYAEEEQEFAGYEPGEFDSPEEFEPEAESEQQQPKVIARAVVFPVLVQETIKGVMEVLSMHGLEGLDKGQLASIYQEADVLEDEPWLIQVGPHLWRAFLQIVPKGHTLVEVVATLAKQSPQYIHQLLGETIESIHGGQDPAGPKEALMELMAQLEEDTDADFDQGDYDDLGYDDGGDDDDGYADPDAEDEGESWDVGEAW